jgi:hypothetical protein
VSEIVVEKTTSGPKKWKFEVSVSGKRHAEEKSFHVTLNDAYWKQLTKETFSPEELVRRSFNFLLARESADEILQKFDIAQIKKYFPEYEKVIGKN